MKAAAKRPMTTRARGAEAEDLAAAFLEREGYRIVARNVRFDVGELDLVAWDGDVLCFVEVRARAEGSDVHPLETIDARKQLRVVRAAGRYLETLKGAWPAMRFDAVGVALATPPRFELVKAAFEASA